MSLYRLNRLFNQRSGRCLDVAIDHGLFGESTFLDGIEDLAGVVRRLVDAGPDAIQLSPGQAPILQAMPGKAKPALVLRTDVANVYGNQVDGHLFSRSFPDAVEQAVRLDAACVVANLFELPGRPDIRESCITTIMALRERCSEFGMPLMIEPLVMRGRAGEGGYEVDGDATRIVTLVRQARELGADVIKADPTSEPSDYHRVVQAAGEVPVLVRGGGKVDDAELLTRTERLLELGVRGIVFGRKIFQRPDPGAIVRGLLAMLHEGRSAGDALAVVQQS